MAHGTGGWSAGAVSVAGLADCGVSHHPLEGARPPSHIYCPAITGRVAASSGLRGADARRGWSGGSGSAVSARARSIFCAVASDWTPRGAGSVIW